MTSVEAEKARARMSHLLSEVEKEFDVLLEENEILRKRLAMLEKHLPPGQLGALSSPTPSRRKGKVPL